MLLKAAVSTQGNVRKITWEVLLTSLISTIICSSLVGKDKS